ncbi:hypothetical protein R1635_004364 [Salmonella enterica]|nr:hypothetical protein [Salmonella enterica]ELP9006503.1 hypothetical protein [Salmonella enterica]ELY1206730.1 hypothetical protein [Salmonella enterica]
MKENIVLNEGVYTLKSGAVIVIEGIHENEPFIEWIDLYKDEEHYYNNNTGYERKSQSLVCEDDFNCLIECFCSYLWENMSRHDFSDGDILKILSYDYTNDRLKIFFELDNTFLKIHKIIHPVFEEFFNGLDIQCKLAPEHNNEFHTGDFNALYFHGRCLAFEDVIECVEYNGGIINKIKKRSDLWSNNQ